MPVLDTTKLRRSLLLVDIHEHAGHFDTDHPKFPKAAKDLSSLITNARRVNDKIEPSHGSEREKLSYLVRNAVTHKEFQDAMATLIEDIQAAADATGAAADAAANRVIDLINSDRSAIEALQAEAAANVELIAQLRQQIADGTVTPESAAPILDKLGATTTKLGDLDSDPLTPV